MGGFGSGDWYRFSRKETVENCLHLDVRRLARDGALARSASGSIGWSDKRTGKPLGSIGFRLLAQGGDQPLLWLHYRFGEAENIELPIRLQTTRPHRGGCRWWFTCPLIVGGVACGRRVAKLYLRGRYFGCRHCHGLTYRSCQQAHKLERSAACWAQHGEAFQALMRRWEARTDV